MSEELEQPKNLVSKLIEAAQYLVNQYGDKISKEDRDDVQQVIDDLQMHDRNVERHTMMMERRISILSRRIAEAEGDLCRTDIHWVKQERSLHRWMRDRL